MSDLVRNLTKPGNESRPYRIGVVIAYTAGQSVIDVNLDGSVCTLPCLLGPSYSVNKTVLVARDGVSGGFVMGVIGSVPSWESPTPDDSVSSEFRTQTLLPVDQGSYYASGGWNADERVSESTITGETGVFFYGDQFGYLAADLTQPYSATLTMFPMSTNGYGPDLYLINQKVKPAGAPTRNETVVGPILSTSQETVYNLPTAWVLALLNGSRGGIGVYAPVGATPARSTDFGKPNFYGAQFAINITYYS